MSLPGLVGTDHIGFTVPDLEQARRLLVLHLEQRQPLRLLGHPLVPANRRVDVVVPHVRPTPRRILPVLPQPVADNHHGRP